MKKLFKNPLFSSGLFLRLLLLMFFLPKAAADWYVPFMDASLQHFGFDPWHSAIQLGVSHLSFPYGYVMWLAFLPLCALSFLLGMSLYWGYGATLLVADVALFSVLKRLLSISDRSLLIFYWFSPIVLFATYWLGLNDLIPVSLLFFSLFQLKQRHVKLAAFFCGAAVSAKLSMVLALPFFFVYLYQNKNQRIFLKPYLISLLMTLLVFGLPFLYFREGLLMLLSNPEMQKIYEMTLSIGNEVTLYLLPMVYLFTLYLAWRIRRISFELFYVLLSISFFLVLLLTPASPGWFLWVIPLFVYYQTLSDKMGALLVTGFSLLYIVVNIVVMPSPLIFNHFVFPQQFLLNLFNSFHVPLYGILQTVLFALGVILILRIWRETVSKNNYFRLSRKPFVLGIGGDSGVGKDTLVSSLIQLFGDHSVASLSGDDYHLWDRHRPMWQVMTHLNPMANDLEKYTQDLMRLADGQNIQIRHYDHHDGKKGKLSRISSNDFIVASGLHALYWPLLRETYDLSVYLEMDESLRRHFKIQRDVHERGYSLEKVMDSIYKREADSRLFIHPQAEFADLILSLQPIDPKRMNNRFKLIVRSRQSIHETSLVRILVGLNGLHVDMNIKNSHSEVELMIEGETSAEDIALAAQKLLPSMFALLDTKPIWKEGVQGLIQLIVLSHIHQALNRRLL